MPARLILNADDFGLTLGINRAIAELHSAGALTSATLMANGPAFDDAIRIAHAQPTLGIGCHIVLTDGIPLSPPETIPTLLGHDRRSFRASLTDFFAAVLIGKVSAADIAREALAQITRIQQQGISLTHVDTHKHTHILPRVARPLLDVAERAGIPAIRNPFEPRWSIALGKSRILRRLQLRSLRFLQPRFLALPQIRSGRVVTTNGTLGISATGHLNSITLRAILDAMPSGIWELVCHPGYNDRDLDAVTTRLRATRDIERAALLVAFFQTSQQQSHPPNPPLPQLINYRDAAQLTAANR
ncbi:ChbG/HpnK family deacetylase [Granulicella sp. L46]|jgi:chitin disaccharide deacetylase|uniref:ChbG/HpnK family deacetylase n=1 Tax=Granulicella sp. L46 TaxID=1641865 RepID=UPI00131DECE3|nr:ChbG/HpnK family deacetylase [Granulicella sp. L46]